jgi:hypothetical protein
MLRFNGMGTLPASVPAATASIPRIRVFIDYWNLQLTMNQRVAQAIQQQGARFLVEFLNQKGRRVIQAGFPPSGIHLATACWASFDIFRDRNEIERR